MRGVWVGCNWKKSMMAKNTICLWYNRDAEEAARFYALFQHDRLLKDDNWRLGSGVAYSAPQIDLFASYIHYLKGTDAHAGRVVTVGVSWPFEIHHASTP